MKGFRLVTLLLLQVFISLLSYCQVTTSFAEHFKMPKVTPASPDAAAIEKFGNFPVNYSTGVPDISIPIWTMQCGLLSWPISLSYHAGGIKVDESASGAGLGWSVNSVGFISRSRVGQPDEDVAGEPTYDNVTTNDWNYLYSVQLGANDSELDIFNFNFNGRSGKFVIAQSGAIIQIPQSNLKIVAAVGLTSFTITDESGITYIFDQRELSTVFFPGEASTQDYNTWYLRRIDLPNKKDSIVFSFVGGGTTSELYKGFTQAVGEKYIPVSGGGVMLSDQNSNIQQSNSGSNVNILKVTSITYPNGSITFNYDPNFREDVGTGSNVSNKLSSIAINEVINGLTTELKKIVFYQSYFYYKPPLDITPDANDRRLRLDSLAEIGNGNQSGAKKYKFQYNTTPLMPRESHGQDIWGFNNGITNNQSLLQSEAVEFNNGVHNLTYTIGNANRNVDTTAMKGWMLSSITYPTGGKTDFVFEAHQYDTELTLGQTYTASANTNGAASPQVTVTNFTLPANVTGTRLIVEMSRYNYPNVSQPSVVSLKDLTTGTPLYVLSHPYANQNYAIDQSFGLTGGHDYELKATTYSTVSNDQITATIRVKWVIKTTTPDVRKGGGLRIKEMIHYTNATIATKDVYIYDTAVTLTPFNLFDRRYSEVFYRFGVSTGGISCNYYYSPVCRVYHANSVYPVGMAMGSPMLYGRVQKINVDAATGAINGKSEYVYDVTPDQAIPTGGQYTIVPILANDWKNGFLAYESHYKYDGSNYYMVKKIQNFYRLYNLASATSLRVQTERIREQCAILGEPFVSEDLLFYPYTTNTGSKRLETRIETDYDNNQQVLSVTTTNYYNSDKYDYPTATVSVDSKNNRDSVVTKRAPDFAGSVYDNMELKNMLAPVIEQTSYTGTTQLELVRNNYRDWNGDQKVMTVDTVQASIMTNPLDTRLKFHAYDTYGNPITAGKKNDAVTTYLYAYNGKLPVAEVTNATAANIAYTSFETDDKGGWTGTFGAGLGNFGSLTGMKAWTQNSFSFSKSGLVTTTAYVVSYWSKNGAYTVNAVAATTGRTVNGWTLYTHKVTPATGTITVTGSGSIDELRLYPALNVQMTTYTYKPLTGVTSKCDANNKITYFEYDELQRLTLVRDQDRNILKKSAYNYYGTTEYPSIYYNTAQSVPKFKQGCTGCQIGSVVTYTVPAGVYLSTQSVSSANTLALAEANAYAQTYANNVGTCTTPSSATVPADNNVTNAGFSVKFHNNCTGVDYTYSLGPNYNTAALSPAPPNGNYTVTFTKMTGPGTYVYWIQGQSQSTSTDPVFANIEVYVTGNQGIVIN
jgi:hypothetical protein